VLVRWQGIHPKESTWEDWKDLIRDFPSLNFEDKVAFNGIGIVIRGSPMGGELERNTRKKFLTSQRHVKRSRMQENEDEHQDQGIK